MILVPGKYYRLRDGQVVGPMKKIASSDGFYAIVITPSRPLPWLWDSDGTCDGCGDGVQCKFHIISEAPAPTEKPEPKRVRFVQISALAEIGETNGGLYALDSDGCVWIGTWRYGSGKLKWTRIEGPEVGA